MAATLLFFEREFPSKLSDGGSSSWRIDIGLGSHRYQWPRLFFFCFLQKWSEFSRKKMNLEQNRCLSKRKQWKIKRSAHPPGILSSLNTLETRTSWKGRKNEKGGRKAVESVAIGYMPCHAMLCHVMVCEHPLFPSVPFLFLLCFSAIHDKRYLDLALLIYPSISLCPSFLRSIRFSSFCNKADLAKKGKLLWTRVGSSHSEQELHMIPFSFGLGQKFYRDRLLDDFKTKLKGTRTFNNTEIRSRFWGTTTALYVGLQWKTRPA